MTKDELRNAIRTRLNELIPSRLELKAGCEFFVQVEQNKRVVMENHLGKLRSFGGGFLFENSIEKMEKYATILGTPPTLQEVLLVIERNNTFNSELDYAKILHNLIYGHKRIYDLTLPLQDQSIETLTSILELLQ